MRKFFQAENLGGDIMKLNEEFRLKCLLQKRKEYYENNVEKIREQKRITYQQDKEKHIEYGKKYRENHREEIYQKNKRYAETHREQRNEKLCEKITCECGAIVRRGYILEHRKSNQHKEMMPNI